MYTRSVCFLTELLLVFGEDTAVELFFRQPELGGAVVMQLGLGGLGSLPRSHRVVLRYVLQRKKSEKQKERNRFKNRQQNCNDANITY